MGTQIKLSKKLAMDTLFQYIGIGSQSLSGLVFYIILMRIFSTTLVGAVALLLTILPIFSITFTMGLNISAQHFTSYSLGANSQIKNKATISKILYLTIFQSILGGLLLILSSHWISLLLFHDARYTAVLNLLAITLSGDILFRVLNGILLGLQKFKLISTINMISWITFYIGSAFMASISGQMGSLIYGWIVGEFLGVVLCVIFLRRFLIGIFESFRLAFSNRVLMSYSLPLLMTDLISLGMIYVDRFIVAIMTGLSEIGVYNLSLLVVVGALSLVTPLNKIIISKFSELFGKGHKHKLNTAVEVASIGMSSIYVPTAFTIAALSPMIVNFLGGKVYSGAIMPLTIMLVISSFFVSKNVFFSALASIRETKILMFASGLGLLSNIALSIALIPTYGLVGAAIGYSSVNLVTFIVCLYYGKRKGLFSLYISGISKIWGISFLIFFMIRFMEEILGKTSIDLVFYLGIAILVYIFSFKAVHPIGPEKFNDLFTSSKRIEKFLKFLNIT